jgi:LPPG:FO 2-phospho-L-lactate transferase
MITCLGGGIGAARVWTALAAAASPAQLTLVVNTADDVWMHGLRICPDIDTTLYALSGRQDRERGWGVRDETFRCMDTLRSLGEEVWFNLGDRDLATHLLRTGRLRTGASLTEVTAELADRMCLAAAILPMSDTEVQTRVRIEAGGWLHYQEFLVRRGARDRVREVVWAGSEEAEPAPGVLDAIARADLVVLAPSNPVASLLPILGLPGVRKALAATAAPVVAITPVVTGVPIADPGEAMRARSRAGLLAALGRDHTATDVAAHLAGLIDAFVLDPADGNERDAIEATGVDTVVLPTLLHLTDDPALIEWLLARARGAAVPPPVAVP